MNYQQYSKFIGNGSALSNNRGEFSFIATIPKGKQILPRTDNFTYISVEHVNYPDLRTYFTLDSCVTKYQIHHQDEQDFMILFAGKSDKWTIDGKPVPIYTLPLVMDGASTYKRY